MGRRRVWPVAALAFALLAGLLPVQAAGAAGEGLDRSFGRDGSFRLDLTDPSLDVANAAVAGFGAPILAGSAGGRFALATIGSVDFNGAHRQAFVDFGRPSAAHTIEAFDQAVTAAGHAGDDFAIAALDGDGSPVLAFGDRGRVRTSFGAPAVAYGVTTMMPGFTRLAVGTVRTGAGSSIAMARLLSDGALDPSFGSAGKIVADVTPGIDSANAVAVISMFPVGPVITVAGQAGSDVLLARYLADGTPDPSFGTGGRVVFSVTPGDDVARAVHVVDGGGIFVSGVADGQAFVGRFSPAGAPVAGFGNGGVIRSALRGTTAQFRTVRWNISQNRVVAAGTVTGPAGEDAVIAAFGPDGVQDSAFGSGGQTVVDFGGRLDQANALVPGEGSDELVVAGGDGADMVGASVRSSDGGVILSEGVPRLRKVDFGAPAYEEAADIVVLPDGRSVVAGSGTRGIILVRLLANGAPDPTFGADGTSVTSIFAGVEAVAVVGEHIFVLGKFSTRMGGWGVVRFSASGQLDLSYGNHGFAYTGNSAFSGLSTAVMAAMPDGRLAVGSGSGIVRLSASGQIETRFSAFVDSRSEMVGLVVQPDGKTVTLHRGATIKVGAELRRFNADGSLDASFRNERWLVSAPVVADANALLLLADGRFLVGARLATGTTAWTVAPEEPDLVLARFTADGALDTTYGTRGATLTPVDDLDRVVSLHQQSDGGIVAVFNQRRSYDGVGLARYFSDGRTDTAFGVGGVNQFTALRANSAAPAQTGGVLLAGTVEEDLAVARALLADPDPAGTYHPVAPVRLLDTRAGLGSPAAKLGREATRALQISGRGGVPLTGVTAVVLNVTVTEPSQVSFLTAWPYGRSRPLASNLNFSAGVTVANMVVVKVGEGGRVNLYNHSGSTHVVADLAGWYGRGGAEGRSGYSTLPPARILDTRIALGAPGARVGPGATVAMHVGGRGGVPAAGVSAVVLNVTATESTSGSYLTAWPDGSARPLASNLNWATGQTVPNLVVVKVGPNGVVNLYNNQGSVHLIADVAGWYGSAGANGGAMYSSLAPSRIYDSRDVPGDMAKLGLMSAVTVQVTGKGGIPTSGASAVVLNVTATEPTADSFLTVSPGGEPVPLASNLNYTAGQTAPNLVVVKVGADGTVRLYNHAGWVHLIVDVAGWYA